MSKLLDSLRKYFQRSPEAGENISHVSGNNSKPIDEDTVTTLMRRIEQTNEGEYSCEETFDLLDEYVELVADDQDVEVLMPLVKKHVDHCPDCGPQYEVLLDILQNT